MADETAGLSDTPSDHFRRWGQAPLAWQVVARELICSGNVLCRYFEATKDHDPTIQRIHTTLGPAMVLYGFAVENLLKALDPFESDIGRLRASQQLPKRVRPRSLTGR